MISDVEYLFMSVGDLFALGKMSIQVFCPFFNSVLSLFFWLLSCVRLFVYFEYVPIIRYMICSYFLSLIRLPFHFIDSFLCYAGAFS